MKPSRAAAIQAQAAQTQAEDVAALHKKVDQILKILKAAQEPDEAPKAPQTAQGARKGGV